MAARLTLEEQQRTTTSMELYHTATFLHCSKSSLLSCNCITIQKLAQVSTFVSPLVSGYNPIQLVCSSVWCNKRVHLIWTEYESNNTAQQSLFTHSFNLWQAHNAAHILHVLTTICTLPSHFQELHASLSHSFWGE